MRLFRPRPEFDAKFVDVSDAKARFSKLLKRVAGGGEPVIAKAGKPVARLAPCGPTGRRRRLGILARRMKVPDAFGHLPDAVLDDVERS